MGVAAAEVGRVDSAVLEQAGREVREASAAVGRDCTSLAKTAVGVEKVVMRSFGYAGQMGRVAVLSLRPHSRSSHSRHPIPLTAALVGMKMVVVRGIAGLTRGAATAVTRRGRRVFAGK